jgi:hypothetical protein
MSEYTLDDVKRAKAVFGEDLNEGLDEENIGTLALAIAQELGCGLPAEFADFLRKTNGLEWNGHILYGADQRLLRQDQPLSPYGIIEYNQVWYENEWNRKYLFLGESGLSWYVHDCVDGLFKVLDLPSGELIKSVETFALLLQEFFVSSLE